MNIGTRPCQIHKLPKPTKSPCGAYRRWREGAIQSRVGAGYGRRALRKWQRAERANGVKNQNEYCGKGSSGNDINEFPAIEYAETSYSVRRNQTHDVFDSIERFAERKNLMSFVRVYPESWRRGAQTISSPLPRRSAPSTPQQRARPPRSFPRPADEVSALTAARVAVHAERYQMLSAQAVAIHQLLAATLAVAAGPYAATEAVAPRRRRSERNRRQHRGLRAFAAGDQFRTMYFGPGAGSSLAAAAAWDELGRSSWTERGVVSIGDLRVTSGPWSARRRWRWRQRARRVRGLAAKQR